MIMQKIKKHIIKIILGIVIILLLLRVINYYITFIQPLIYPYFFKVDNIEKLIGKKLPKKGIYIVEYEIDAEPTYNIGRTKGFKGIYAKVEINRDIYNSLLDENHILDINDENHSTQIEEHKSLKNYKSLNIENIEEIKYTVFRYTENQTSYSRAYGIFYIVSYNTTYITSLSNIYMVLTKEIDEKYYLYVFN